MSGHSKWSKVKHQKQTTDAAKAQAFTRASHALAISVKEGGGVTDPNKNSRLRLAIEQARAVNMPKDTIERAIRRASSAQGKDTQHILYEGYGPGGVAYIVETETDNHQRTGAALKHIFEHAGGTLASPGAVEYLFSKDASSRMEALYPTSVSDDLRKIHMDLIASLQAVDDVTWVTTTMGK
ncbi:MAG TPA: YebC/PmpR family DNA-binding transcriptional regulator [Patescibacteria group bacterium]|nr:YebC/PmpR family DNA-binding transcriptional regulator [Patescibacteria group bacterium]